MRRGIALWLSALLLWASVLPVSADGFFNDDRFDWGEYACSHTHTERVEAVASTCTEQGHAAYLRCVECRLVVEGSDEPLPLAEHVYDNACDATCNACDVVREVGAHDYVPLSAEPPTCEADGFERFYCTLCGDVYTDTIPSEGHRYDAVVTAPDCENSGYTTHTCSECGDSYTDNAVDALGHAYDDAFDATCNVCGAEREAAVRGDVDGNGKVNNRDLGLLQKYLNGTAVDIAEAAADLDGNGKVNNRDLGLLQKLLNR